MKCQNCKNPVNVKESSCEWCGSPLGLSGSANQENVPLSSSGNGEIELFIKWEGKFVISFNKIEIIVDGRLIGKGSLGGFELASRTKNPRPEIILKSGFITRTIILPNDVYFSEGHSYLIDLEWSSWTGFISNKPKTVTKIK